MADEFARRLASTINALRDRGLSLSDVEDTPLLPGRDGLPLRDLSRGYGPQTAAWKWFRRSA